MPEPRARGSTTDVTEPKCDYGNRAIAGVFALRVDSTGAIGDRSRADEVSMIASADQETRAELALLTQALARAALQFWTNHQPDPDH
jgi:hypothetical protein